MTCIYYTAIDALGISILLPGLGQIYNGQALKAFLIIFTLLIWQFSFGYFMSHVNDDLLSIVFWGLICIAVGIYGLAMIDAVRTARKIKDNFRPRFFNAWYGYFLFFILAMILFSLNKTYLAGNWLQAFVLQGTAMEPTINRGNRVLVNFIYYHSNSLKNGDIVLFLKQDFQVTGQMFIGRVVAQAGDVYPENNYLRELPDCFVYIQKDNVNFEDYGIISTDYVLGKIIFRFWDTQQWKIGPL